MHDYVLIMNGSLRETSGSDFSFWYSVCHHGISLWVSMAMTWRNCKNEPEWQHSYGSYGNSQSKARPPLTPPVCYSPLERDAHCSGTLGRINKIKTKWCDFTKRENKTCMYKTGQKPKRLMVKCWSPLLARNGNKFYLVTRMILEKGVLFFKKIDVFTIFMLVALFSKSTFRGLWKDMGRGVKAKPDCI